jgi:glycerol-3-phosphate acyltransferase PlsX
MGGDAAPQVAVDGARKAAEQFGIDVVLVGRPEDLPDTGGLEVIAASEVIAMDADPAKSVRRMKDSSLVVAAEAVRDGAASAMVSAGNTGATMASALLRMGRIKGVARPAIATPVPCPGGSPTVMLDAGANAECSPEWLAQFAMMGAVYARERFDVQTPRVGLLSIGEEPGKGNALVKETYELLADEAWQKATGSSFVGNIEGRDLMSHDLDVAVTDGFTGNVALKTLEGSLKMVVNSLFGAFDTDDDTRAASQVLMPALAPLYGDLDPNSVGGAMLLGVRGVCVISHGSSSVDGIANAVRVASDLVTSGVEAKLTELFVQP